ncbi:hypothetical protein ACJX0J_006471, partial [Zea mays]
MVKTVILMKKMKRGLHTHVFMVVYVDDILLIENDIPIRGILHLGMQIYRDRSKILRKCDYVCLHGRIHHEYLIVNGYTDASFQINKDDSQSNKGRWGLVLSV